MARTGRPSKLTPELTEAICKSIEETGCDLGSATERVGITHATLCNWRNWGAKGRAPYADFFEAITRARATWRVEALRKLEAPENFVNNPSTVNAFARSIQWKLERLDRELFGQQVTVKVAEAKTFLLDAVRRACEGQGRLDLYAAILDELERGDSAGASATDEPEPVH